MNYIYYNWLKLNFMLKQLRLDSTQWRFSGQRFCPFSKALANLGLITSLYILLYHVVEMVTFFLDGFPHCFRSEKCEIYKTIWSIITMAKWNKSIFLYIHCKVHKNWISSKAHSLQIQQEALWWTHCNFECILIKTIMLGDQL